MQWLIDRARLVVVVGVMAAGVALVVLCVLHVPGACEAVQELGRSVSLCNPLPLPHSD